MIRRYARSPVATRRVLATLLICASATSLPGTAQADALPRAHLAIDGLALSLGDAQDSVVADWREDIDATGIRLRVGLEFGRPGYGLAALGWHRRGHSPAQHHRGERPGESRGEPRRRRVPVRVRGPRLGMEMHAAFTITDRGSTNDRTDVSLFGGYLTGRVPLGHILSIKGLAGLASVGIKRAEDSVQTDARQSGFGYGVGLEASLGRYTDLTVDWMQYLSDDAPIENGFERVAALGVGLKVRF